MSEVAREPCESGALFLGYHDSITLVPEEDGVRLKDFDLRMDKAVYFHAYEHDCAPVNLYVLEN